MGFNFGGFVVQLRAPVPALIPLPQSITDLTYDPAIERHEPSARVLEALYGARVRRIEETVAAHEATSAEARFRAVAVYRRCILVFDRGGALGCDFERDAPLRGIDAALARLTSQRDVARTMVFSFDSVSETYAFAVFEGGARVRRWAEIPTDAAPISIDEGVRLPTEPTGATHPESRIDAASTLLLEDITLTAFAVGDEQPVFVCEP